MTADSETCDRVVIVTDGNERSALAVTRALGEIGCRVIVGAEDRVCLAGASKFCSGSFSYPSPYKDPSGFVSAVLRKAGELPNPIILPVTDIATKLLCQHRSDIERIAVAACPPADAFERLSDKYNLMQLAKSLDVPIPDTLFVPNGDVQSHLDKIPSFPVVVKPGCSLTSMGKQWIKTGVLYANNPEELVHIYKRHTFLKQPSLIQQRIEGDGQGIFALMKNGSPIALFAHRRVRERPPSGGVSVFSESIPLPENMTRYAMRLLQHVHWNGVAMVEFKVDRATGEPFLMEINGRFWGSLQLAIDAGVNFPVLLAKLVTGSDLPDAPGKYRTGVRLRWFLGDLDHLLLRLFKIEPSLSSSVPSQAATLISFFKMFGKDLHFDVYRRNDIGPFQSELKQYGQDLNRSIYNLGRRGRVAVKRRLMSVIFWVGCRNWLLNTWLPENIQHILVLCHGNVCRSPLAEAYLKHRLNGQTHKIAITSAGLDTQHGRPAHPFAVDVGVQSGLFLGTHLSVPVDRAQINRADLILVMDDGQREQVINRFPDAKIKTIPLGYFCQGTPSDIADPFFGSPEEFRTCLGLIKSACDDLLVYVGRKQSRLSPAK